MSFKQTLSALMWAVVLLAARDVVVRAQNDDGFRQFYGNFQKAIKTGDKEAVARLTNFDLFTWEESDSLKRVKTKEAFLKNYNRMFTKVIKNKIATAKPVKADEGYFILWHTKDLEYSLYFAHEKDWSYSFLGLTIGPR